MMYGEVFHTGTNFPDLLIVKIKGGRDMEVNKVGDIAVVSIILCSLQSHVSEVFGMAGFTPLFTITDTVDEAIKQLS